MARCTPPCNVCAPASLGAVRAECSARIAREHEQLRVVVHQHASGTATRTGCMLLFVLDGKEVASATILLDDVAVTVASEREYLARVSVHSVVSWMQAFAAELVQR